MINVRFGFKKQKFYKRNFDGELLFLIMNL